MRINISLILFFALYQYAIQSKTIQKLYEYSFSSNVMRVFMGDPRTETGMNIDLESNITRITQEAYTQAKTVREIKGDTIYYSNTQIECIENEDIVHFEPSICIPSLRFYITDNEDILRGSNGAALAFAYSIPNCNHSLTHLFKEHGIIDELRFTLERLDSITGIISFGELKQENIANMHHTSCQVNGINGKWDCDIDNMIIGEYTLRNKTKVFRNKYSAYFSSRIEYITAPKEGYDFMIDLLFQEHIDSFYCHLTDKSGRALRCNCSIFQSLEPLSFTINNRNFTFNFNELYYEVDKQCVFAISENDADANQWVLGNVFLKKYKVSFSYDHSNVAFYSNKPFVELEDNRNQSPDSTEIRKDHSKGIIISIFVVLFLFAFCLVYSKCKYFRREQNKKIEANSNDYQKIIIE